QLKQFPHKKAFSQKPGKRLYRRHFFPKKRPLPSKIPQKHVYFQCFRNIASLPCETVLGGLIHSSLFVLGRGLCPDISQIYSIFAPENINAT
ncbi:MAG: hypothetical protein MR602_00640, partial [Bacteroidales bacterium]|nr:hypothetical protein [Bacteroidales bacterium]